MVNASRTRSVAFFIAAVLSACSEPEQVEQGGSASLAASPPATAAQHVPAPRIALSPNTLRALIAAADRGDTEAVKQFLQAGINADAADRDGWTALMFAAQRGHLEAVTLLLDAGAHVNVSSRDGVTPLMTAALAGHRDVVEVLLRAGADVAATNKAGTTARAMAQRRGQHEIAQLLAPRPAENTQVAELQNLLTELGFDPGVVDGLYGAKTAAAVRVYQQATGLTVDGMISSDLIEHVRRFLEQQRLAKRESDRGG